MKQFVLKDDAEPGFYPGLGDAEHGKPLTAYGEDQEKAFAADKRFKAYHAPKEDAPAEEKAPDAPTEKPADGGKGKK